MTNREGLVWGDGPVPSPYMIIGEAPGAEEERTGRPFVGRSGGLLEEAINAASHVRSDIYITNCYKLRPPYNRNPTEKELYSHWKYLWEELNEVNPSKVLLLGGVALWHVAGLEGISRRRGSIGDLGTARQWYATYHPAYILRRREMRETFFNDVKDFLNAEDA